MDNENKGQPTSLEAEELAQLWQGIETNSGPSAQELAKLAKRNKLKNTLIFAWDWLGCVIMLAVVYYAINKQASYVVMTWLLLGSVFSIWLTIQFNKYRVAGTNALSGTTANYNRYLSDKAKADIKVGKLINLSSWGLLISMIVLVIAEQVLPVKAMIDSKEEWLFVIGWTTFWISLWLYYGYKKIRKGKQALKQLQS